MKEVAPPPPLTPFSFAFLYRGCCMGTEQRFWPSIPSLIYLLFPCHGSSSQRPKSGISMVVQVKIVPSPAQAPPPEIDPWWALNHCTSTVRLMLMCFCCTLGMSQLWGSCDRMLWSLYSHPLSNQDWSNASRRSAEGKNWGLQSPHSQLFVIRLTMIFDLVLTHYRLICMVIFIRTYNVRCVCVCVLCLITFIGATLQQYTCCTQTYVPDYHC